MRQRTPFGEAIMRLLGNTGETQTELAGKINSSQSFISDICRGRAKMPRKNALLLAEKYPKYSDLWYEWLRDIGEFGFSVHQPLRDYQLAVDLLSFIAKADDKSKQEFLELIHPLRIGKGYNEK